MCEICGKLISISPPFSADDRYELELNGPRPGTCSGVPFVYLVRDFRRIRQRLGVQAGLMRKEVELLHRVIAGNLAETMRVFQRERVPQAASSAGATTTAGAPSLRFR